jgi:hypothetical protein
MAMHAGESYRCEACGAEIQVTKACPCPPDPGKHSFKCCGVEMKKTPAATTSAMGSPATDQG